jgi:DivIVA domain
MVLNSLDVQNRNFSTQMRGYSKKDVEEFLEIISRDYDDYAQKVKNLERENKNLSEKVEYFEDMKDSLNKSIVVAQSTSENLKDQAEIEANNIVTDAKQKAEIILDNAKMEAGNVLELSRTEAIRLVKETDDLKRAMRSYHQRMRMIVEAQLENINASDWDEIFKPAASYISSTDDTLKRIIDEAFDEEQYTSKIPLEDISNQEVISQEPVDYHYDENQPEASQDTNQTNNQ